MTELRAGEPAATWLPEHGMVASSLRHRGDELLGQRGGLDAYPVGHAWAPRGETFVAWEPMTAPTNALVSGRGLRHVAPGDTFAAAFTVSVADAG